MTALAVETLGLRKVYKGKTEALKPIDLRVPEGSCFGLLGPNGAGKSTLVKALLTIVHATEGKARLLGQDHRNPAARRSVGYLPEGHAFPKYLDGRGVCLYFGRLSGLSGSELKREVAEKLDMVGMGERSKVKISKCSKGMKQRIGLAQALLGNPRLIFLDEPTDGVDPMGRADIRNIIKTIAEGGSTVFLNSHLLAEVEQICNYAAILNHGELVTEGTLQEIRNSVSAGNGVAVRFRCGPIPDWVRDSLLKEGADFEDATSFVVRLADDKATTPMIDRLREEKVGIYAVEPLRATLEDAFIDLVSRDDDEEEEGGES